MLLRWMLSEGVWGEWAPSAVGEPVEPGRLTDALVGVVLALRVEAVVVVVAGAARALFSPDVSVAASAEVMEST